MKKPQRMWTTREITALKRMVAAGIQSPAMAKALKRSPQSVRGKVGELGLKVKRGGGQGKAFDPNARQVGACTRLRLKIDELLANMAPADVTRVLGTLQPQIPGTERIHKTSSVERMAA